MYIYIWKIQQLKQNLQYKSLKWLRLTNKVIEAIKKNMR